MAFHPKSMPIRHAREETDSERIVALYLAKIENFTGAGRRNRQLLSLAEKEIASNPSILSLNIAEIYYNGAPGIAINLDKTIEYYVVLMEVDDFPSEFAAHILDGILGNVLEVHDLCSPSILPVLANRLDKVSTAEHKTFLGGLSKIFRGRFFDMDSKWDVAIESYADACHVLRRNSCSELLLLHCQERIEILGTTLNSLESEEWYRDCSDDIVKIKEKYSALGKLRRNPDLKSCSTSARMPGNTLRIMYELKEDVDPIEAEKIEKFIRNYFKETKQNRRDKEMKENLRKEMANRLRPRLHRALETARSEQFSSWLYEELDSCVLSSEKFSDLYDFRELIVEAKSYLDNRQSSHVMKRLKPKEVHEELETQDDPIHEAIEQLEPEQPINFSRKNIRKMKKEQAKKEKMRAIQFSSEASERRETQKLQDNLPQLFESRNDHDTNYVLKEAQKFSAQRPDIPPVALKARAQAEYDKRALSLATEMSLAEI